MKKIAALLLLLSPLSACFASNEATNTVSMRIDAINEFSITGAAPSLTINSTTDGIPDIAFSSNITYGCASNGTVLKKITGSIDAAMPINTNLYAELDAPSAGGVSSGPVLLSTSEVDLVTSIPAKLNESGITMTYSFEAIQGSTEFTSINRQATFTLTDN